MSNDATRIAFVRARLDERERVARATLGGHIADQGPIWVYDGDRRVRYGHITIAEDARDAYPRNGEHIASHDPSWVLADIASKRRTLDRCAEILSTAAHWTTVESADELDAILAEQVVRDMATAFERHPDYREACRA